MLPLKDEYTLHSVNLLIMRNLFVNCWFSETIPVPVSLMSVSLEDLYEKVADYLSYSL